MVIASRGKVNAQGWPLAFRQCCTYLYYMSYIGSDMRSISQVMRINAVCKQYSDETIAQEGMNWLCKKERGNQDVTRVIRSLLRIEEGFKCLMNYFSRNERLLVGSISNWVIDLIRNMTEQERAKITYESHDLYARRVSIKNGVRVPVFTVRYT